ncbi:MULTISPECIES: PKD domain-containing protein [unclassified Streptomyces]|uniref:PKD domain-containing protein n=1 Tax=unclassified Streptomyces TaxID=2593676 RepID=UPI002E100CCA|nr:PKD domain-containing protein [Streptomyces sp. NBC_01296]WSW62834.1 PKD domain-containing protein [Streptomyces sp. NBC_00998]
MAHAADQASGDAHGVSQPDLTQAGLKNGTTFTSPADRSTRRTAQSAPAAKSGTAAAPMTAAPMAETADANPTLAVGLEATPITAHAITLASSITSAATPLDVSVAWGDGAVTAASATGTQVVESEHTYAELGTYTVKVTVTDKAANTVVTNEVAVTTGGSDYTPYGPTRLLDTRNGTGAPQTKVAPYSSAHLKIGGNGGIPAGVTAVVLNVTVTDTTSGGHVTAYADGDDKPTTSNVNFVPGQTVPNLVIVPVGENGYVNLYNGGWESVDLIADVTGYFTQTSSSGYTPLAPQRFVDTRSGTGTAKGQVAGYGSFSTQITGLGKVPATGVTAVALNVTVTNPKSDGHLTVYPSGQQAPTASNVNFTTGQTIANSVIVPVGPDGKISVRNGGWNPADVIVDVVGYYSPQSKGSYLPFAPERMLDTRDPKDPVHGPLAGRDYIYTAMSEPGSGITGFVLNTTVTNTGDSGFLAVAPDPNTLDEYDNNAASQPTPPGSSTLNWTTGKTVPNLVQASTGGTGVIDFWNQSDGNIDLIVDVFGMYQDN